ncbi:MAG TPA: DUF1996 domain-containing protein [Pedococcus sp.]|nr:DUF1996 domain-containing protein [Pedococcus sp.]
MHRRLPAALMAAVLALIGIVAASPSASALLKVKCKQTTGTAAVDPIVHHNESTAHVHDHQFFGNNSWLAKGNYANYSDLVGKGTNCRELTDTAGYWTPTLRYTTGTRQAIPVQAFTAYYRPFTGVGGPDTGPGLAFPADARLIGTKYSWTCGQFMSVAPSASVPSCVGADGSPGKTLTLHIDFPNCWDGIKPNHLTSAVGNTTDNAHYAYSTKKSGVVSCPAGFPQKMVSLRESLQFKYIGAGTDVELSSDPEKLTSDGRSAHGDFWNAWQQADFQRLVVACVNTAPEPNCAL